MPDPAIYTTRKRALESGAALLEARVAEVRKRAQDLDRAEEVGGAETVVLDAVWMAHAAGRLRAMAEEAGDA